MLKEKAFKEMTKEEQEVFLKKRKEISRKRYVAIKAINAIKKKQSKAFKQKVHSGNKLIDDAERKAIKEKTGLVPYVWVFNPTMDRDWLGCGLVVPISSTDKNIVCNCTYSIKSPSDIYKPHIGRGLCGVRLESDNPWKFEITVPKKLYLNNKESVQKAVSNMISTKILLCEHHIPQRLLKKFQ